MAEENVVAKEGEANDVSWKAHPLRVDNCPKCGEVPTTVKFWSDELTPEPCGECLSLNPCGDMFRVMWKIDGIDTVGYPGWSESIWRIWLPESELVFFYGLNRLD